MIPGQLGIFFYARHYGFAMVNFRQDLHSFPPRSTAHLPKGTQADLRRLPGDGQEDEEDGEEAQVGEGGQRPHRRH